MVGDGGGERLAIAVRRYVGARCCTLLYVLRTTLLARETGVRRQDTVEIRRPRQPEGAFACNQVPSAAQKLS